MEDKGTVLVTGGTGFVARQIILHLLQKSYRVRTTVRNPASKTELKDMLIVQGVTAIDHLSFAEAELTKDDNWQQVMKGIRKMPSTAGRMASCSFLGFSLDAAFEDVKYEELLIILLRSQPELAGIFFNFDTPQKINIEAYMNRNFRFNVSLERFALLTGRSLSAFKRDFKAVFKDSPSRWLVRKRLQEAYFLVQNQGRKPSDIYLELGFESLSHFSVAFKKEFGIVPTSLKMNNKE